MTRSGQFKFAAVLLLALAIGALAFALLAGQERGDIQGPSAVEALPDGTVWLTVEDRLWRLDPQGRRQAVVTPREHGVHGLIANLVLHPNGQLVASVRDDPDLHFLDAATGAPRGRVRPIWPQDLAHHGDRAITYAFHGDGRIAISTGGGHAVALFDAKGRFQARTAPGVYEFSNGLWWHGDRLWTTDTNRPALVELDGSTLAQLSRVDLRRSENGWRYLGMAAGPAAGAAAADAPLGSVVRFANGMIEGHVVQVLPNGEQRPYPAAGAMEPRDVKWRGNELLVVDGARYAVRRYAVDGKQLPDFGDNAVRQELSAGLERRASLQRDYQLGLVAAVVLFVLGFGLALLAQATEKAQRLAAVGVDLSQLGTPVLSMQQRLATAMELFWPVLLGSAAMGSIVLLPRDAAWFGLGRVGTVLLVAAVGLGLGIGLLAYASRKLRRARLDPDLDALLNQPAVAVLASTDTFWSQRDPDEVPRETLILNQLGGGRHWLVLTNQRLLVFVANLRDYRLKAEYPRRDVLLAAALQPGQMTFGQRLQAWLSGGALLRFELRDGSVLQGSTPAAMTADRVAALLRRAPLGGLTSAQLRRAALRPPGWVEPGTSGLQQALASLLVPGLGQWLQRRSGTAVMMFVPWLVLVVLTAIPLVWALWGPRTAVAPELVQYAAGIYALMCVIAAVDAWRLRRREA